MLVKSELCVCVSVSVCKYTSILLDDSPHTASLGVISDEEESKAGPLSF